MITDVQNGRCDKERIDVADEDAFHGICIYYYVLKVRDKHVYVLEFDSW